MRSMNPAQLFRKLFRSRLAMSLVAVAITSVVLAGARTSDPGDDDANSLLRAYSEAARRFERSNPTRDDRIQFYRDWLGLLFTEYERTPPNQAPESVRFTCLALANGVEDFVLAEVIAVDGSMYALRLQDRLAYWDQRVALRETAAARTGSDEDRDATLQTAIEALGVVRSTLDDPLFQVDPVSVLSVQRLFRVASHGERAAGAFEASASLLEESASFVRGLPESVQQSLAWSWWADQCLQDTARDRVDAGDLDGAIGILIQINGLSVRRAGAGEHALLCAGDVTPLGSFREGFARAWLAQAEDWGSAEAHLAYMLAFHLANFPPSNRMRLQEAVDLLESVLAHPAELAEADIIASAPLLGGDQQSERWMSEPVRSNVLCTLALTYARLGEHDEAAVIAGMVVSEYPDHPAFQAMEAMLD